MRFKEEDPEELRCEGVKIRVSLKSFRIPLNRSIVNRERLFGGLERVAVFSVDSLVPFRFQLTADVPPSRVFNRYPYNQCVLTVCAAVSLVGSAVLVSVICASFQETLAPVRQTLAVPWATRSLLVRRRLSKLGDLSLRFSR